MLEDLENEESITGPEAVKDISEKIQTCLRRKKEERQRQMDEKSMEIDREAMGKALRQRLEEQSMDFGKHCKIK